MLKKIIVASTAFVLFACSSDDGNDDSVSSSGTTTSSSSQTPDDGNSSSSVPTGPDTVSVSISAFGSNVSTEPFKTYPYGYTLKEGEAEDLEQFWNSDLDECPTRATNDNTAPNLEICQKNKEYAILQNNLTNQYSYLHYSVDRIQEPPIITYPNYAIKLQDYNLTAEGDQAALGLNVGADENEGKTIEQMNINALNGAIAFSYKYKGGAHEFRIASTDSDFWYFDVEESEEFIEITIPIEELKGNGVFAANEDEEIDSTHFDLLKVSKFLWVVEYKEEINSYNTGSLLVDDLKATVVK